MKKSASRTHNNSRQQLAITGSQSKNIKQKYRNNKTTSTVIHTESEANHMPQQATTKKNSCSSVSNLNRVNSCAKINNNNHAGIVNSNYSKPGNSFSNSYSKANILKLENSRKMANSNHKVGVNFSKQQPSKSISQQNQQLIKQNQTLKQQCLGLQQNQLKNRQKIQSLITRISELKQQLSETTGVGKVQQGQLGQKGCNGMEARQENSSISGKGQHKMCVNPECIARKQKLQQQLYHKRIKIEQLECERKKWEGSREQLRAQYKQLLDEVRKIKSDP